MLDPHVTHEQIAAEARKRFGRHITPKQREVAKVWAIDAEKGRLNNLRSAHPSIDYFDPRVLEH